EGETHRITQLPPAQVDGFGTAVIQLNVLVVIVAADGVVHQFVNHYVAGANAPIGSSGTKSVQTVKLVSSIGPASHGHPIFLTFKLHGIQHAALVGTLEVNGLPSGAEFEIHVGLAVVDKAACGNPGVGGDNEFIGRRVIGQDAAGDIHLGSGVVIELDVV